MNTMMTTMIAIRIDIDIVWVEVMLEEIIETETMIIGEVEVETETDQMSMREKTLQEATTITTRIEDTRIVIRVQETIAIGQMRTEVFIVEEINVVEANEAMPDIIIVITIVVVAVAVIITVVVVEVITVVNVEAIIICRMNKVIKKSFIQVFLKCMSYSMCFIACL